VQKKKSFVGSLMIEEERSLGRKEKKRKTLSFFYVR